MTISRLISRWSGAVFLLTAAATPTFAQFDMIPYRPYNGQYRTSSIPAEYANSGDAALAPMYISPRQVYRQRSFEDRLAEDLETDRFFGAPAGGGRARRPDAAAGSGENSSLAEIRRRRDEAYFAARSETNPKAKAKQMENYRREVRSLDRALSSSRPRALPAREAARTAPATTRPRTPAAAPRDTTPRPAATTPRPSATASPTPPAAAR